MKEFLDKVFRYKKNFSSIRIGYSDKSKIENVALKLLNVKDLNQLRDRFEGALFYKRFLRELSAEIAVERHLNKSFINWEAKSAIRDYPSMVEDKDLKIGITSFDFGEYPILIDEAIDLPQIFTIFKGNDTILICGYASIETLRNYREELPQSVISMRKVSFTGFEHLETFETYNELKTLYHKSSTLS